MRILVIGAGPSGLAAAKTLKEQNHLVSIIEGSDTIGGTFENKRYQDACMVSSKHLTCFSDYRRPEAEMHMSLMDYAVYLRDYAAHFGLVDLIRFNTYVIAIEKKQSSYVVELKITGGKDSMLQAKVEREEFDAVAVCSGVHNIPRIPTFSGQESFAGKVMHSAFYKDPEIFRGKKVVVIGTGETGFDLGYAAATHGAASVTLATRHGFLSVPAAFGEKLPPLDCIIMNFGTHYWESNWAQRVGLHWWVTTKIIRLGFFISTGCSYGFNQWTGKRYNLSWDQGSKHIVNKSSKCMPLITRKVKKQAMWWQRWLYSWWDKAHDDVGTDVDLIEGSVSHLDDKHVYFNTQEGVRSVEADIVMLATGYRQRFPFLFPDTRDGDDPLPTEHFIINPEEPRLAYIGFVRPNVGAIPPMAELQAMWWSKVLDGGLPCKCPAYYKLTEQRLSYGVDYGRYMFCLAGELRAIPSLLYWLFKDPRIFLVCSFGQAHIPIFRLRGPFQDPEAKKICTDELLKPILQRPIFMNLAFLFEALCFGAVNGLTAILERREGLAVTAGVGLLWFLRRPFKSSSLQI
eukprot:gnl/MRDRNA2_/MRDRNA2_36358_c0_seq1.p1 gnl/MRDRNA2_/MRDRNA2_36358_c0~~gnl/MRDRNA2_/MRDRNA2_36358_c0_seq1.p1  ORF type:complete len:571 (+),score=82.46 gnl/MRDRNA2_/MRDRNA2_36358_c0_seq1:87-1799(+)